LSTLDPGKYNIDFKMNMNTSAAVTVTAVALCALIVVYKHGWPDWFGSGNEKEESNGHNRTG
jgi:hypothetical protein